MNVDQVKTALLNNVENEQTQDDGVWGSVYLDNARFDLKISKHSFAGYLSALEGRGEYRQSPDDDGYFGRVKVS